MANDFDDFGGSDPLADEPEDDNPFEANGRNYQVGYGRPPKKHQFTKGNRAAAGPGRRKKTTRLEQAIRKIAGQEVVAVINGKRVRMTRRDALAFQLFERASKSPKDLMKLAQLLLNIEDEPFANIEEKKITIEFVGDRPKGLPGCSKEDE